MKIKTRPFPRTKKVGFLCVLLMILEIPMKSLSPRPEITTLGAGDLYGLAPEKKPITFAVATIKRNPKPSYMKIQYTLNGFTAYGVTLRQLIQMAYGISSYDRLTGEPKWVDLEYFDVEAKVDDSFASSFSDLSWDQRGLMLQSLLADRFGLLIRRAPINLPVYDLVVEKGGPKLQAAASEDMHSSEIKGVHGLITRSGRGVLGVEGFSMNDLARYLEDQHVVDKPVVDHTGLVGYYNFVLHWVSEDSPNSPGQVSKNSQWGSIPSDPGSASTIYKDIKKQLGLGLEPSKGLVETFIVDRATEPTGN